MISVKEYLEKASKSQVAEYSRICKIVKEVVPTAEEVISYGMPAFKYKNRRLLYFGAFKNHMSIFPGSRTVYTKMGKKLDDFRVSKGTLQFTEDMPISDKLIREIINIRVKDIDKS